MSKDKWDINNQPVLDGAVWHEDLKSYLRDTEPDVKQKSANWSCAIGLQAVDGLVPSEYLLDVAKSNINGKISIKQAKSLISSYYSEKREDQSFSDENKECDIVSSRIAEILGEKTFNFSPAYLKNTHERLFEGLIKKAGSFRDYNITKKEWILKGDTVAYSSYDMIESSLEYDFSEDKKNNYDQLNDTQILNAIAKFISGIWQIHPFGEGNTRTCVVFMIKRLTSLGFRVNNEPFQNDSWYFRNALVRANYRDRDLGVTADDSFLKLILRNAMFGENNVLRNRYMHIDWTKDLDDTPQDTPQNAPKDTPQDALQFDSYAQKVLSILGDKVLSATEIMKECGLSDRKNFRKLYLQPCLSRNLIEMTIPEKPTSKHQKYKAVRHQKCRD